MRYDMAVKRAERLLRSNWQKTVQEAHRLAGLGIPTLEVAIQEDYHENCCPPRIKLWVAGAEHVIGVSVTIYPDGGGIDLEQVALVLQVALEELEHRAQEMGRVAQTLAAAK